MDKVANVVIAPREREIHHRQWPFGGVELQLRDGASRQRRYHQQFQCRRRSCLQVSSSEKFDSEGEKKMADNLQIYGTRHRIHANQKSASRIRIHDCSCSSLVDSLN